MKKPKPSEPDRQAFEIRIEKVKPSTKRRLVYDAETAPIQARIYARIRKAVEEAERLELTQADPKWRAIADAVRLNEPAAARLSGPR